jgi:hypothetical protein
MPREGGSASEYDDAMTEQLLGVAADVLRSFGSAFGGKHLAIVGRRAVVLDGNVDRTRP